MTSRGIVAPEVVPALLHKLVGPAGHLYVVEIGGELVACGGWYLDGALANLSSGPYIRRVTAKRLADSSSKRAWKPFARIVVHQAFGFVQRRLSKDSRAGAVRSGGRREHERNGRRGAARRVATGILTWGSRGERPTVDAG
jgi:hypothetical protein